MLVLSRKKNEWIDISGGFEVGGISFVVVEIQRDKVRIGIEAAKEIPVHRREVRLAIERDQQRSADQGEDSSKEEDGPSD